MSRSVLPRIVIVIMIAVLLLVAFTAPQNPVHELDSPSSSEVIPLQVGESVFQAEMFAQSPVSRVTVSPDARPAEAHISGVLLEQTAQALKSIRLDVINANPTEGRTLTIGYVIAPARHPDAWNNPVYTSPERVVPLGVGQIAPILFDAPDVLPPGSYQLGAWSHLPDGEPVITLSYDFRILPPFTFALESFTLTASQLINPQLNTFGASFVVTNQTESPRVVSVFYSVVSSLDSVSPWRDAVYTSPVRFMSVNSGETYVFVDDQTIAAPPGSYRVIAWLHELVDGQLRLRAAFSENLTATVS